MNPYRIFTLFWITFLGIPVIIFQSCKEKEEQGEQLSLTVNLPRAILRNEVYYLHDHRERSIELEFNLPIDSATINGNISFSETSRILDSMFTTVSYTRKIIMKFHPGFQLSDGWRYWITIKPGLRSTSGVSMQSGTAIEVRTTAMQLMNSSDTTSANSILCISDIHLGETRAFEKGYCWFSKNSSALESLLDRVLTCGQVRQLVILGDLFDGWVVPYSMAPFDSSNSIFNSRDYFISVANAPVNINIISKLQQIAVSGVVSLVYVPGNHDMLLTKDILQEIIPGIIWQGDTAGLGHYSPLNEMIMEHGHRYDFFNCPQPLTNPGHILPPGYFISRLDAEGLMEQAGGKTETYRSGSGEAEFLTAWAASFIYLEIKYSLNVSPDSMNIMMTGIDNYFPMMSFNGVRDMYAKNIENVWPATEAGNGMPVVMPVLMAILNGSSDLSLTANYEYFQSAAPKIYKIVVFGHTHNPLIDIYPAGKQYTGIYANTGSWVNSELTSKPVRTFVVINPGEWTGSDLDIVSLYQYNLDSGNSNPDPGYIPVLISEESIER